MATSSVQEGDALEPSNAAVTSDVSIMAVLGILYFRGFSAKLRFEPNGLPQENRQSGRVQHFAALRTLMKISFLNVLYINKKTPRGI